MSVSDSPTTVGGRVWKRVRLREEEPPNSGGDGGGSNDGHLKPISFRDVVLQSNPVTRDMEEDWDTEDFVLKVDDVQKSIVKGVPTIDFSDRVYGLIDESMSLTFMVKLLGWRISYNALWNKVCALWKPFMRFQLIDIENKYYLTKFESGDDYNNILSEGP